MTVIVLDNAGIHTAHKIKERLQFWQQRRLFIFYSPYLNIIERLWKELKARWLKSQDYSSFDDLCFATFNCINSIGSSCIINFSPYS